HHTYSSTPPVPLQSREPPQPPLSESRHTSIVFFVNQSTKSQKHKQRKPIREIIIARLHHHHPHWSENRHHQCHEPQSAQSRQLSSHHPNRQPLWPLRHRQSSSNLTSRYHGHCRENLQTMSFHHRERVATTPSHLCLLHYCTTSSMFLSARSQDSMSSTLQLQSLKIPLPTITRPAKLNQKNPKTPKFGHNRNLQTASRAPL
ncbi:hypothetical protein V8G54_007354, partial [Vigna mungo]